MKIKLLLLLTVLAVPSFAGEYEVLSHEYDLVFQSFLVKKILKLPKHCTIRVSFKDGSDQYFHFEGYAKYDDALWVAPVIPAKGLLAIFGRQALAIQALQDVNFSEPV